MLRMAKRKSDQPPKDRKLDRHADRHLVTVKGDLFRQLKKLAERDDRPLSWQLRRLLVAGLAAEGLWPPPS